MKRTKVESSNLASVGYDTKKKILEIEILDASKTVQMNELNVSLKGAQALVA